MSYTTIISPAELIPHLNDPQWVIVDCRFALGDPDRGRKAYEEAHIPGAVHAHLNDDLSGPIQIGVTGRHPLPTPESAAATFGRLGIGDALQVVVYDDAGGALPAARLWWMLHWLGHPAAAVLDGGWQRWQSSGQSGGQKEGWPTASGVENRAAQVFTPRPRAEWVVSVEETARLSQGQGGLLWDARAADRFRGENETIHPVAGHIPGARSVPYAENLTAEGVFKPAEELRARYRTLLGSADASQITMYCGSGVTATHNLLAMQVAGLGAARLYPGSWSEWITDPRRPTAKG